MTSPSKDIQAKMAKIQALTDSIERAKIEMANSPSVYNALALQHLQQQRQELRGLIPKPRLVAS